MTPTLSVLLCLGLCLGQRMRTQADRPSLSADKGPLVPLGSSVTLGCLGSWGADMYRLQKEQESGRINIQDVEPSGGGGQFLIRYVTAKDAGNYSCLYRHSSHWSGQSDPLQLVVTGLYAPPSLSAWPSSQVTPGQQVTLQCLTHYNLDWLVLYKEGEEIGSRRVQPQGRGAQANFSLPTGTPAQGETYRCYAFYSNYPYEWSAPSDPLVLRITGPALQDYTMGNLLRLSLAGLVLIILGVLLREAWLKLEEDRAGFQLRVCTP